jgi:dienelactone hydrolase
MQPRVSSIAVVVGQMLLATVLSQAASAAQVEIDAPIVPKPGDSIVVRVRFDKPLDTSAKPSADLLFPSGDPQPLRDGQWNQNGTLWTFAPVKLGANKGLAQLIVRAAVAADGTDTVVHEEPLVVGTEPILAQLRKLADWMIARPHDFIFVEGYFYRTFLGLYEITGEKRYLDLAKRGAEKILKRQAPEGYWATGYGSVYLADTGSALGLLTNLYKHATPDEQKRIDNALNRYVELVLVRGDSKGRPFVHKDGSLGVGFDTIKKGKVIGEANKPYTIATSLTGAEVFAALYYMHGNDPYKQIAMKACDWLFGTMSKEGVFPYILEDWNPRGANRDEVWKSYRYNTAAYVGEGMIQAWTYIDDPAFRKGIETRIKPNIDWLVRTQNADGSWGNKATEVGLFDQARSHGVINVLVWYHENVQRDPRVAAAIRRYYLLLLDDNRTSYQHVASPKPVKSRYRVPLDYVATSIAGRALIEIIKPGADCYRWKPPAVDHSRLMTYRTPDGRDLPVRSADDWAIRRKAIMAAVQEVMGKLPDRSNAPPLDVKVIERVEKDGYERISLTYQSPDGDRVPAYLLLPKDRPAGRRLPAIMALHGTGRFAKKTVTGEAVLLTDEELKKADRVPYMYPTRNFVYPNMNYGQELAQRGYVVLAPDYPAFGDYPFDYRKNKYGSGCMKGIVNHMRGVDLLAARDEVDPGRIGAIGHSLGGHNALLLGLFDQRVKVVVASAAWSRIRDTRLAALARAGKPDGWDQDVLMPRVRTVYGLDLDRLPFDLPELVAAMAPRAVFSNSPVNDEYYFYHGAKEMAPKIHEVFALFGAADRFQIRYPVCAHDFPPEVRRDAYAFIDRALQHTPSRQLP